MGNLLVLTNISLNTFPFNICSTGILSLENIRYLFFPNQQSKIANVQFSLMLKFMILEL